MADIELVIKMPEEVYKQFRKDQREKYVSAMISTDIIANGIPLSKWADGLIVKVSEAFVKSHHTREYIIDIIDKYIAESVENVDVEL